MFFSEPHCERVSPIGKTVQVGFRNWKGLPVIHTMRTSPLFGETLLFSGRCTPPTCHPVPLWYIFSPFWTLLLLCAASACGAQFHCLSRSLPSDRSDTQPTTRLDTKRSATASIICSPLFWFRFYLFFLQTRKMKRRRRQENEMEML